MPFSWWLLSMPSGDPISGAGRQEPFKEDVAVQMFRVVFRSRRCLNVLGEHSFISANWEGGGAEGPHLRSVATCSPRASRRRSDPNTGLKI
jgi:hypothetical protein